MKTKKFLIMPLLAFCLICCNESQKDSQTESPKDSTSVVEEKSTTPATEIIDPTQYKTENMENIQQVHDFIKKCGVYYLATDDNGQPRVRPFGTIHIFEGKLYIQTGHKKRTSQQLAQNPKAELCAFDAENNKWIRVSGTMVEDNRIEAKKSMLDEYTSLRRMYDENDDNTAVYFFKDGVAYISSYGIEDVEIRW